MWPKFGSYPHLLCSSGLDGSIAWWGVHMEWSVGLLITGVWTDRVCRRKECLESWCRDAIRSLWRYFFLFVFSFSWSSSGEKQCPRGIGHNLWKISDLCTGSFCINLYFTWTLKPVEEVPRAIKPGTSQTSAVCCSVLFWRSFKEADAGMGVRLCPLDLSWNSLKKASLHLYVLRFCTLSITFVKKTQNKTKQNCCALQPSKKILQMFEGGFQNNVFTQCRCPCNFWRDLLIQSSTSRIWSLFPHFPTDCILTASTMGLRTRMLLVYGHAGMCSETILLQSRGPAPLQFLAAAQDRFQKQNTTSLQ